MGEAGAAPTGCGAMVLGRRPQAEGHQGREAMQVTELSADGLKREYKVIVQAQEIEARVSGRLNELSRTIRMPGFRPGKVPVALLRKQYGRSVMGEVLEQAVNQGSQQAISEHELRPALRPKIEVTSFEDGADLEFTMALEVLPEVPKVDLKAIELSRPVAEVSEEAVTAALDNLAERFRDFTPPAEVRPSQSGDRLIVDFHGSVGGEAFEGGHAHDFPLVLGSGRMVPGFEDQLVGKEAGGDVTVEVTFPEAYGHQELAGKTASFAVHIKEIAEPQPVEINDDLAKGQGFEDLAAMRKALRDGMEREYGRVTRLRMKRALLDRLAETCKFQVPTGMVDLEFESIWRQLKDEMAQEGQTDIPEEPDEKVRTEYYDIAERRVRLGLILSDVGQANDLKVEQTELNAAILDQARRYPGQEQKVLDFFKNTPQAIDQLRAPLYEDKVVDFILQMATVTDHPVTPEELMKDPDDDPPADASSPDASAAQEQA
jgi:trigger factor